MLPHDYLAPVAPTDVNATFHQNEHARDLRWATLRPCLGLLGGLAGVGRGLEAQLGEGVRTPYAIAISKPIQARRGTSASKPSTVVSLE